MDIELNGNLIIIGGAEDKKGRKKILDKVCNCINKERDILLVVTVATLYPKEAAEKYRNVFTNLGVRNIEVLNINSREDSYKDESI